MTETHRIPGRYELHRGREVTIRGLGRCRFYRAHLEDGELSILDVVDPRTGGIRTVVADRLTEIHRTEKLR